MLHNYLLNSKAKLTFEILMWNEINNDYDNAKAEDKQ